MNSSSNTQESSVSSPSPSALASSVVQEEVVLAEVPLERIETELCSLGAHIDAAMCRWLLFLAEFDRREGYRSWECQSAAHWLAWKCGISLTTGREHVRVARALEDLPRAQREFAAGRLSYSKVRAISRVADEATENALVELALDSPASVVDVFCRQYRRHGQAGTKEAAVRSYEDREFTWFIDDNGDYVFSGRMPAEMGAVVVKMIGAARHRLDTDPPAGGSETADEAPGRGTATDNNPPAGGRVAGPAQPERTRARNADALALAARSFLDRGPIATDGAADRFELNIICDLDTLLKGADGPCHLDGGPHLGAHVVRRLACDCTASITALGTTGDPMYTSRHQRVVNRRLRRALQIRDRCCTFPGCGQRGFLQAHHVIHWVNGGLTVLDNLTLVCGKHHRAVHEGGCVMVRRKTGELVVYGPDGRRFDHELPDLRQPDPAHPDLRGPGDLETLNGDAGLHIDHRTNRCGWEGRSPNIDDIIQHLDHCQRRNAS